MRKTMKMEMEMKVKTRIAGWRGRVAG